jgi:uncharacterized protein (TIGR00725 family)
MGVARLHIAVIGAAKASETDYARAEQIGRLIAEADAVLVCGGLGGVMEGACRGARSAGGTTVGILPGTNRLEANDFVDVAVPTGIGEARNALVVGMADAVIAVGGEFGTLSEMALALKMGTAVIGLDSWELARSGGVPVDGVEEADDPVGAVAIALERAAARPARRSTDRSR